MKRFMFLFFILLPATILGNKNDSIVKISELSFNSEIEKTLYFKALKENDIGLDIFLVCSKTPDKNVIAGYKTKLLNSAEAIKKSKLLKKPPQKRISPIIERINKEYLGSKSDEAMLLDLLEKKEYSSLSSTILYALIFEELNIPYNIKYTYNHVYLNPYPVEEKSTDTTIIQKTAGGVYTMQRESRKIELELLSKTNNKLSIDQFKSGLTGGLRTLVGLQYYNQGQLDLVKKEYLSASANIAKAYYFVDFDNKQDQLFMCLAERYNDLSFSQPEKLMLIPRLFRFKKDEINEVFLKDAYKSFYRSLLNKEISIADFNTQSRALIRSLTDPLAGIVNKEYLYYTAMYNYRNKNYKESFSSAKELLKLSVDNENAKNILVASLGESNMTSQSILRHLETALREIPGLRKDHSLSNTYITYKLNHVQELYLRYDFEKGEKALEEFEILYPLKTIPPKIRPTIAEIFDEISKAYYFRNKRKKALEMVNKGLELDPDNYSLQKKKKALK